MSVVHILSPLATSLKDSCTVMAWLGSVLQWELRSSQLWAQLPWVTYMKPRRYYSLFSVCGVWLSRVRNPMSTYSPYHHWALFSKMILESDCDLCRRRRQTMQEQLCLALFLNTWYLAYLCGSVGFSKPALSCVDIRRHSCRWPASAANARHSCTLQVRRTSKTWSCLGEKRRWDGWESAQLGWPLNQAL